ncbi:MAG: HlyC/CorC family transporter, partial [Oscillospiraceae bacterium]|nr:HlyC/CorC family transporter [Oscillospiraceae bacterium]
VTMEDLLEEIVGKIYDEFDPAEKEEIVRLEENLWRVAGTVRVEELAEELEMDLSDEDYDTVAGMVFSCLSSIPGDDAQPDVEVAGLEIHVESIRSRRIESVLIRKAVKESGEEDED